MISIIIPTYNVSTVIEKTLLQLSQLFFEAGLLKTRIQCILIRKLIKHSVSPLQTGKMLCGCAVNKIEEYKTSMQKYVIKKNATK